MLIATKAGLTRQVPTAGCRYGRPEYLIQQAAEEPAQPRRRADRPVAAAPHRFEGAARRAVRRDQVAARRRRHPSRRAERGLGRRKSRLRRRSSRSRPCRTATTSSIGRARTSSTIASSTASGSSRGFRSRPAIWRSPARCSTSIARRHGATPGQIALAWVLKRSPVMLPIPAPAEPTREHRAPWSLRSRSMRAMRLALLDARSMTWRRDPALRSSAEITGRKNC